MRKNDEAICIMKLTRTKENPNIQGFWRGEGWWKKSQCYVSVIRGILLSCIAFWDAYSLWPPTATFRGMIRASYI